MSLRPPTRLPLPIAAALTAALAMAPAAAAAGQGRAAPPPRADRLLDVRQNASATAAPPATDRVTTARRELRRALGSQAILDVDPLTGTVRRLQRLDGALTAPSSAAPAAVARSFLRDHAAALGLTAAAAGALAVASERRSASGLTVVTVRQAVDGVPAFDDGVKVGVDRGGRVISVAGAPRADLPTSLPVPRLAAAEALSHLMDATGAHRPATVVSAGRDAQRTTRFSTGDTAELVLFGARRPQLAWHLIFRATSAAWFDAVVDATTGAILYRANLVKSASARLYDNYPGAPQGGTPVTRDYTKYLSSPMATSLAGPYVHAFADINANDQVDPLEDVIPTPTTGDPVTYDDRDGCDTSHLCTWNSAIPTSWQDNRAHTVTQAFWYANVFHDHLAAAPIGFSPAEGAFEGDDALELHALDGADTTPDGGPDADHVNNASMAALPDGMSPIMEMYLFSHTEDGGLFRDANGADDAAIVFHEYTHGLSGRLITTAAGTPALNAAQAAAMGEGFSDWYAEDFLVRHGLESDAISTDGDIDIGRYVDAAPHGIRSEAMDCAVGSAAAACPGTLNAGRGGYTYGDLGRVASDGPEPHADGEIWAQTLWQLRTSLVTALGPSGGSNTAERLITDAMRLSPPEPSFLDLRDAILAADVNATGGANAARIWNVFRSRGMGFYASSIDSDDIAVVEDFSPPPDASAPRGSIAGTVSDSDSGLPVAGATVAIAGLASAVPGATSYAATTDAGGRYAISGVPQGTYPKVLIRAAGYDTIINRLGVTAGQATAFDGKLTRNWAASGGGARITATSDDAGAPYGCGAAALIDQSSGLGWSAVNTPSAPPWTVVRLPAAVTITAFGLDPSNTCGDRAGASAAGYRIETSADGVRWKVAAQGTLDTGARRQLNRIAPSSAADGVRFVRLTLLSPLDPAERYVDATELEVFGQVPNTLPSGTLTATPSTVGLGSPVTLDASSFTDPDSAITAYDWDLDGDGDTERTTTTPTTEFTYGRTGTITPSVTVRDFRGGSGTASTQLTVAPSPKSTAKAKPKLSVPRRAARARIRVRVICRDGCRLSGTVAIDRRAQRRGHLRSRTVIRVKPRTIRGTKTVTLALSRSRRAQLRRHGVRRVTAGVRLKAVVPGGDPRTTLARTVRLTL